eukprot:m.135333 g.135333  ORF g.135333 m.135333 type:complete len:70 (-) comp9525_c0_seq9:402-611(-)
MASMSKNKKSKTDGDAGENKEAENTEKLASKSAQQERMFRNMSDKLQRPPQRHSSRRLGCWHPCGASVA